MFFRSLVALLALLVLAGGCTPGSISPQTAAAAAQSGDALPSDVEKAVGPAYRAPELQALVNRVGQRLVTPGRRAAAATASSSSTSRWPTPMPCRAATSS